MGNNTIIGSRPLIGMTDNVDAGPTEVSLSWKDTTGSTVFANGVVMFQSGTLKHGATIKRLYNGKGARCTVTSRDEDLTLDVVAVPVGISDTPATALTNAQLAASLPRALSFATIANGPDIACGPYAAGSSGGTGCDSTHKGAINGTNWLYEGGGTVEMANEIEWGLKFTLVRSQSLATQVAKDL